MTMPVGHIQSALQSVLQKHKHVVESSFLLKVNNSIIPKHTLTLNLAAQMLAKSTVISPNYMHRTRRITCYYFCTPLLYLVLTH